ncbi:hypothetical protein O9K51_10083 [Purpureocillium lavendulum]|uniref:Uncharacterized protein n=1 Tax=Purpureocillium lavendulum TaxID=1247861 RepID=A0AB34FFR7_9HYPO|nr:hypothetical protein O9K51_10083 [Purpureocillium lavendulum]
MDWTHNETNMRHSVLEKFDDLVQITQANAVLRVTDIHLLSKGAELAAEASLAAQAQALNN